MSGYDKLIQNIENLENVVYNTEIGNSSALPLSKFLLDEKGVCKKILKQKNPQLTDDECSFIVDSVFDEDGLLNKESEKSDKDEDKKSSRRRRRQLTPEEEAQLKAESEARKQARRKQIRDKIKIYKETYSSKLQNLLNEAKELLREIRQAIFRLLKDVKDITKKLITNTIQTASSIPGVTLMIVSPPWNIPGAITTVMLIVVAYLDLLDMTKSVVPFLNPIRKLPTVTDKQNLNLLSSILNVPITILNSLWAPIALFGNLINELLTKLIEIITGRRNSIFRKATARLRSLGYIPHNPEVLDIGVTTIKPYGDRQQRPVNGRSLWAYSDEDAEEVADILNIFRVDGNQTNPNSSNRVVAYRDTTVDDLKGKLEDLQAQLVNEVSLLPLPDVNKIDDSIRPADGTTVFDVELPDGSKLYGISQEQLDELKISYNVIVRELQALDLKIASKDTQSAIDKILKFKNKTNLRDAIFAPTININDIASDSISATIQNNSSITNSPFIVTASIAEQVSVVFTDSISSPIFNFTQGATLPNFQGLSQISQPPTININKPNFKLGTRKAVTFNSNILIELSLTGISSAEQINVIQDGKLIKPSITFSPSTGIATFRVSGNRGQQSQILISAFNQAGNRNTELTVQFLDRGQSEPSGVLII